MATVIKLHPKLAQAGKAIEKRKLSLENIMVNPSFRQECIDSGSTVLNLLIGGSRLPDGEFVCPGWPRGSIIELFGRESSGKSTIAMTAMGQALLSNGGTGCGVYVDLEHAVKDVYAKKLGCDFRSPEMGGHARAVRLAPHNFEETEAIVNAYAMAGVDLIVVDSVAGLVSAKENARDTTKENTQVAEVPRLMSQWMPKLMNIIAKTKTTVIFINQTRDKIGAKGYTEEALKSTTGGNALKFWSTLRIMLQPKQSQKAKRWNPVLKENEEVPVATDILVKMVKNKIDARQGHSSLITLRYGIGIDELRTMLNIAQAYKIVKMSKNGHGTDVFTFESPGGHGVVQGVGAEKFRVALKQNPQANSELLALSINQVVEGFKAIDDAELAELAETAISTSVADPDDDPSSDYAAIAEEPEVVEVVAGVDYENDLLGDATPNHANVLDDFD